MTTPAASIPVLSREYVYSDVVTTGPDAAVLTTLPVEMAFLALPPSEAKPVAGDWKIGSWVTGKTTARCLVGPGGAGNALAVGTWYVWLRISGATEQPVRSIGKLKVT